jgi:hypothetical protein
MVGGVVQVSNLEDVMGNNKAEFLKQVESQLGKPRGWPADFQYSIDGSVCAIEMKQGHDNLAAFRKMDCWGLAFFSESKSELQDEIRGISFRIPFGLRDASISHLESFKRRLSFLNANNEDLGVELVHAGASAPLYDSAALFSRPSNEIVIDQMKDRSPNQPGTLEKDVQTFLFGGGESNRRLALFGEDFASMPPNLGIEREYPTGVFDTERSEKTRILPTYWTDIVTLNRYGDLAVIELKLDDTSLEVISQILDYALFFSGYIDRLRPVLADRGVVPRTDRVVCYVVNNRFHPRLKTIAKYYATCSDNPFQLRKVLLGATEEFGQAESS